MTKIIKNLFVLMMALVLLPFSVIIFVCCIPIMLQSLLMGAIKFHMENKEVWEINNFLEALINFFIQYLMK